MSSLYTVPYFCFTVYSGDCSTGICADSSQAFSHSVGVINQCPVGHFSAFQSLALTSGKLLITHLLCTHMSSSGWVRKTDRFCQTGPWPPPSLNESGSSHFKG